LKAIFHVFSLSPDSYSPDKRSRDSLERFQYVNFCDTSCARTRTLDFPGAESYPAMAAAGRRHFILRTQNSLNHTRNGTMRDASSRPCPSDTDTPRRSRSRNRSRHLPERRIVRIVCAIAAGLLLALAPSGDADAQRRTRAYLNGDLLLEKCGEADRKFCDGYIAGIVDVLFAGNPINGIRPCIAEGVTVEALRDIVLAFLVNRPQYRKFAAPGLTAGALEDRFPCR